MRDDWDLTGIPVNINLGRISQLDKLKANPNFARYIATHKDIPSEIRKQAQKIAPRKIAPRKIAQPSPHRGGERDDRPSPSRSRDRGRSRSRGETGRIAGGHHFNYGGIVSVL